MLSRKSNRKHLLSAYRAYTLAYANRDANATIDSGAVYIQLYSPSGSTNKTKTRKPCCRKGTARSAAVVFGLKFADSIHYKFKSTIADRKPGFRAPNVPAQNRI